MTKKCPVHRFTRNGVSFYHVCGGPGREECTLDVNCEIYQQNKSAIDGYIESIFREEREKRRNDIFERISGKYKTL